MEFTDQEKLNHLNGFVQNSCIIHGFGKWKIVMCSFLVYFYLFVYFQHVWNYKKNGNRQPSSVNWFILQSIGFVKYKNGGNNKK